MTVDRYCCHGLGVLQPINELAAELDQKDGARSFIVGGMNPPLEQPAIEKLIETSIARQRGIVWIGHSMGAALGYYLAQKYTAAKFRLVITVDPMCWASNLNCPDWDTAPPQPGHWRAYGDFGRWINIRSSMYPGGGVLDIAGDDRCAEYHFPEADHIGIIDQAAVREIIFDAVAKVPA